MADVFSSHKRSEIMSRVKGRGNAATEMRLISVLRQHRITGWRRQYPLFGKPDFVFPKQRLVVFVDGCFWHNCPIHGSMPTSNIVFWQNKLQRNSKRDHQVNLRLRKDGWRILRVWQHELSEPLKVAKRIDRQLLLLSSVIANGNSREIQKVTKRSNLAISS